MRYAKKDADECSASPIGKFYWQGRIQDSLAGTDPPGAPNFPK